MFGKTSREAGFAVDKNGLPALAVSIALVQVALYYLASSVIRADGSLAIAQPDTLLYCQAARRIAEGFPFSFSAGTAVSTGTTSVIYPFLLAVFHWVGFRGPALITAGFLLNAVFYLLFVAGWTGVARRVFSGRPLSMAVAVVLVPLFGPFAYCALAQSDIGLWMAVSAWIACGFATGERRLYAPLLAVAPWVRPEGMILVACFAAFSVVDALRRRRLGFDICLSILLALSAAGVFALNYALTGDFQFSSVAQKGHFNSLSPCSALYMSAADFMRIAKSYFLGIPQDSPRDFFYLPVAGAAFMWIGVFARSWRGVTLRELAWYLAMLGCMATVASSGWQNTNLDRYLVWIMPVLLLYMAFGAETVSSRLKPGVARMLPFAAVVAFTCAMAVVMVAVFGYSCSAVDTFRNFARRCDSEMPAGASVGVWGTCGIAYEMSDRRVAHFSGIYSPEFFTSLSLPAKFETLKNEPSTRVDYCFCRASDRRSHYCGKPDVVVGPAVLVAPPDLELRKCDWSAYEAASAPPKAPAEGVALRARVDVVYDRDERDSGYEQISRDDYPLFAPFHRAGSLGGADIVEAGRFLLGGDAMTVPLSPGRDVHVVMRTALGCTAAVERELGHRATEFSLKSPMRLQVLVDGEDAGTVEFDVSEGDFCDAHFTIPGRFVASESPRLSFLGEHIAFCYWFYQ